MGEPGALATGANRHRLIDISHGIAAQQNVIVINLRRNLDRHLAAGTADDLSDRELRRTSACGECNTAGTNPMEAARRTIGIHGNISGVEYWIDRDGGSVREVCSEPAIEAVTRSQYPHPEGEQFRRFRRVTSDERQVMSDEWGNGGRRREQRTRRGRSGDGMSESRSRSGDWRRRRGQGISDPRIISRKCLRSEPAVGSATGRGGRAPASQWPYCQEIEGQDGIAERAHGMAGA